MAPAFAGAARALADDQTEVVAEWLRRFEASPLRVPRRLDLRPFVGPARGIAAALALGLAEPDAAPGTPALREAEKLFAFVGGNFDSIVVFGGARAASAFDVAALVNALRDVLADRAGSGEERAALGRLFDWLAALALEGHAGSRVDALRLRHRDALEKGTPVILVTPELPAALLVGDPERPVLDAVFGRLLLLMARAGARAVIVDGGGLAEPLADDVLGALAAFARHPKVARVGGMLTLLSGLAPAVEERWTAAFSAGAAEACERFDDAVARAQAALRGRAGP